MDRRVYYFVRNGEEYVILPRSVFASASRYCYMIGLLVGAVLGFGLSLLK